MMETNLQTTHKIFSQNSQPIIEGDVQKKYHNQRWLEFVRQISRLDLAELPETKTNLDLLLSNQQTPEVQALIYIGLSRYYKGIGNLLETAHALGHAHSLINDIPQNNTHAYLFIEMAILLSTTGNIEYSQSLLEKVMQFTDHEPLQKYAHFRYLENQMRQGNADIIPALEASLSYFRKQGDTTAVANHHKAIGNAYRRQQRYTEAMHHYIEGLNIALRDNYSHIVTSIEHDIAMLYFHTKENEKAVLKLREIFKQTSNHYIQCITLSNAGFIELKSGNQSQALNDFTQALTLATEHGIYHRITGLSYYIGEIYKDLGNLKLSGVFYKQGFKAALNMVENHFPCSGDTLRAMKGYYNFQEYQQPLMIHSAEKNESEWDEIIDKSLQEAKNLFQGALLEFTINMTGSKRQAAKQLGVSERSIFTVLERINTKDSQHDFNVLNEFLRSHQYLSWKEINQKFETEFISNVYKNHHNIKLLAQELGISYSSAVQKVKLLRTSKHD